MAFSSFEQRMSTYDTIYPASSNDQWLIGVYHENNVVWIYRHLNSCSGELVTTATTFCSEETIHWVEGGSRNRSFNPKYPLKRSCIYEVLRNQIISEQKM